MAQGDDRKIPVVTSTDEGHVDIYDLNENVKRIWEALHSLEGRRGQVNLRSGLRVGSDTFAEYFAGWNLLAPNGGLFISSNADGEVSFSTNAKRTVDSITGRDLWTCVGMGPTNITTILQLKQGVETF